MFLVSKCIPYIMIITLLLVGCDQTTNNNTSKTAPESIATMRVDMNSIAQQYVKLVLTVGKYDADYVDAYYGPESWSQEAAENNLSLIDIETQAQVLLDELAKVNNNDSHELTQLRHSYLTRQLMALKDKVKILQGNGLSFDDEALALYDAKAPTYSAEHFDQLILELDSVLPGQGDITNRYLSFREQFIISKDLLESVFDAALSESRKRTLQYIDLPEGENFKIEYVNNKAWSGYNYYQGNFQSLIQINTDFPIYIDRALDLAAHEAYPGHHVYNALLEANLMQKNNFIEFSVYPLFSPQSLIAEGSANYGIEVAFPGEQRLNFEREVLFPLAHLDPNKASDYSKVQKIAQKLSYAGNEAARAYLNGEFNQKQAIDWLVKYALFEPDRAAQRIKFIEKYRSYVINYNWGQDLVKRSIEKKLLNLNESEIIAQRWKLFEYLLSTPQLPSNLAL